MTKTRWPKESRWGYRSIERDLEGTWIKGGDQISMHTVKKSPESVNQQIELCGNVIL